MFSIGAKPLSIEDYKEILFNRKKVHISDAVIKVVQESHSFLESFHSNKVIYGISTGLGPMAQFKISSGDQKKLQYNVIRSHASGIGKPVDEIYVKSALITLLNGLLKGKSGIHPHAVTLLKEFINRDLIPFVPEHGGVGASGDLVQLAHIALALIGEGEIFMKHKLVPAGKALSANKMEPLSVYLREGLSLINGTGFMTGTGIVNLIHSKNIISWAITASSMINEIVCSFNDYFSLELNRIKLHLGQNYVAAMVRNILRDSNLIRKREEHFFNGTHSEEYIFADKVQEYYSIRCVPQIIGPIIDTINQAENVLFNEANSSTDNPVIDPEAGNIFHGGNFHGDYISFEMDKLKIALTKLSMLFDRQINYLMNNKLNDKLPPFINLGILGVNFGMQGAQFTATSTVAENQTLSYPNYLHSIPNNNDNQDIVSMGTNSAQLAKKIIDNTYQVLAIEMLCLIQAIDYLNIEPKMASYTRDKYLQLRKLVPRFEEDTIKYPEIAKIRDYLYTHFIILAN
ncbi:MAG: aromatic amino acid lyase [Bacteroidales bacterium]|nr:aromatic amino acid lyase [Bacteroidales bacterium]